MTPCGTLCAMDHYDPSGPHGNPSIAALLQRFVWVELRQALFAPPFPTSRAAAGRFSGKRPWAYFEEFTRDQMARVVGATREEVILMNGLSVNLHLGLVSYVVPTTDLGNVQMTACGTWLHV